MPSAPSRSRTLPSGTWRWDKHLKHMACSNGVQRHKRMIPLIMKYVEAFTIELMLIVLLKISYDASMQNLQKNIQEHLAPLLMDQSSIVKRAVLHDISSICIFL